MFRKMTRANIDPSTPDENMFMSPPLFVPKKRMVAVVSGISENRATNRKSILHSMGSRNTSEM